MSPFSFDSPLGSVISVELVNLDSSKFFSSRLFSRSNYYSIYAALLFERKRLTVSACTIAKILTILIDSWIAISQALPADFKNCQGLVT